jgi:hypothetical protein
MNCFTPKNLTVKLASLALGLVALTASAQTAAMFGDLPLCFETGDTAQFVTRGRDSQFVISPTGAQLALHKTAPESVRAVQMQFVGADTQARIHGDGELSGKINYLVGNNPAQWRSGVPTFAKVRVEGIYPGINLVYYGNQQQLEYDFNLASGVNPDTIAIRFQGADKVSVNAQGELVLTLGSDEIRQPKPVIYQTVGDLRKEIAGGYKVLDAHTIAFAVGRHDPALPLVIDPVLSYSTYFGGISGETAWAVAVDTNGFVYVAGQTFSAFRSNSVPFSTPGAYQTNFAGGTQAGDAFVAKFDNLGTNLIYQTYLGGSGNEIASALAVDSAGNAYITGFTDSTNFPLAAALYTNISGVVNPNVKAFPVDAFVAELGAGGSNLVYSTYLGGSSMDGGYGIALDAAGAAYVTGFTYSSNFPTVNALQNRLACTNSFYNNANAFVAEIAPGGTGLVFSTYLGGTNFDQGRGIAVDASGIYVTGFTGSTNFPTTNYISQTIGTNTYNGRLLNSSTNQNFSYDAFVTKFAPSGTGLIYSTLLGSTNNDIGNQIAVDAAGNAYVAGSSTSMQFPNTATNVPGLRSYLATNTQTAILVTNAFLTKIKWNGTNAAIDYSALFGGQGNDAAYGVAVDPVGNAFVVGGASSANFPTNNTGGFLRATNSGQSDVFITAFNTNATSLLYSAYLGGNANDVAYGVAVDPVGNAYIVGQTYSGNFPTTNAAQVKLNGTNDTFLAKILLTLPSPVLAMTTSGTNFTVSWPVVLPYEPELGRLFKLEFNDDLSTNNWQVVPSSNVPQVLTNGRYTYTFTSPLTNLFLRLHAP